MNKKLVESLASSGLSEQTIEKIQQVFSTNPNVRKVRLYGSRAKGNFQKGSDIDLTIMGDDVDHSNLLKIENELDDLLLPYKIDLSLYRYIKNADLIEHIQRVGVEIYASIVENES